MDARTDWGHPSRRIAGAMLLRMRLMIDLSPPQVSSVVRMSAAVAGRWRLPCVVAACFLAALMPADSTRAAEPDFYAGKTLTLIAGLPPGGGVDGEMRV